MAITTVVFERNSLVPQVGLEVVRCPRCSRGFSSTQRSLATSPVRERADHERR